MRKITLLLGVALALGIVFVCRAAPVPGPTSSADRWEYCELHHNSRINRGGFGAAGGVPGLPPAPAPARIAIRLVTADEEMGATDWDDLATKLKAPEAKKDATELVHRLRVLNYLGEKGWELVAHEKPDTSGTTVWTFKRKAGK